MTIRIVSALLASSMFIATPAFAQQASADDIASLKAQIAAMQAQINQLQAQQTSQSAQVQQAQAALAKVQSTPAAAAPSGWFSDTKIGGKAYFDASTIFQSSDGVRQPASGPGAELKRFYVTVDHKFNDVLSANLTTDFRYGTNGTSKDVLVYVKKAYFQAKFSPALYVRVGAADLPWVPFAEDVYGYRFVENVMVDRTKFGTSADWGVHVGGETLGGKLSYAISAVNGAGYKTLSRSSDSVDLEGRVSFKPVPTVVLAVGGYTGKLGKSVAGLPETPHSASRFDALAAYVGPRARFGVEYFAARNWNNVLTAEADRSDGYSMFGSFNVSPKVAVFGRYDWVNPSRRLNDNLRDNYLNVGVDYTGFKNIDLALVYKHDRVRNGFLSTSNGTIGGIDGGTYSELGMFGQLKF